MLQREYLGNLYLFVQVATEGSFSRAAARLGMAQSGVSRSVSELEAHLGVPLMTRSTRKLALTAAGERLYRLATQGFEQLESGWALMDYLRETPGGTVRINASRQAIEQVLLPKLAPFGQQYPDIRLALIENNQFVDIVQAQFDAGVRYGNTVADDMVAVRIGPDVQMALVATPEFFARHGQPRGLDDLGRFPSLGYQLSDGSVYAWEFKDGDRTIRHKPQVQWVFSDSATLVQAAELGLVLVYEAEDLMQPALQSGRLLRVLPQYSIGFTGFHLYYPHRQVSPALRLVVEALRI